MKKLIEAFKKSGMTAKDVAEEADLPLNILTRVFNGNGKLNDSNKQLVVGIIERAITEAKPEVKPTVSKGNNSPIPPAKANSPFVMKGSQPQPEFCKGGGYYEITAVSFIDSSDNKTTAGVTLFDYETVRIDTGIKKINAPVMAVAVDEFVVEYGIRLHSKPILINGTYHIIMYCHGAETLRIVKGDVVAYVYPLK